MRLEMLLGLVPALCALSVFLAACAGELNSNYTAVLSVHVILLLTLVGVGLQLKVQNSLHAVSHYLEDAQRSNDLLVMCSWAPLLAYLLPMLFLGDARALTDTYMTVIGYFLLYVPLLDAPQTTAACYAVYSCLAGSRVLQLSPEGVPVSNFLIRTIAVGLVGKMPGMRIIQQLDLQFFTGTESIICNIRVDAEASVGACTLSTYKHERRHTRKTFKCQIRLSLHASQETLSSGRECT